MAKQKNWSQEELEYLNDKWGTMSITNICKKLGRSYNAVVLKASRLKLGAFAANGETLTLNQLILALGYTGSYTWMAEKLKNKGLPIIKKKVRIKTILKVDLEKFWKWAEENKDAIDWSKSEENVLGNEPQWVKERRKIDFYNRRYWNKPWSASEDSALKAYLEKGLTYIEIGKRLNRSSCAVRKRIYDLYLPKPKREKARQWTKEETEIAIEMRSKAYSYKSIAERIGRSEEAVRGKLDRVKNPSYVRPERRNKLDEVSG